MDMMVVQFHLTPFWINQNSSYTQTIYIFVFSNNKFVLDRKLVTFIHSIVPSDIFH